MEHFATMPGILSNEDGTITNAGEVINAIFREDEIQVVERLDEALKQGKLFVAGYLWESVANNGTAELHFRTTTKKAVIAYSVLSEGKALYGLYPNPTVTVDGTEITPFSRNQSTIGTPTAEVFHTPTATIGTVAVPRITPGGSGGIKAPGSSPTEQGIVLSINTEVIIRAQNVSTTTSYINIILDWYEIEV